MKFRWCGGRAGFVLGSSLLVVGAGACSDGYSLGDLTASQPLAGDVPAGDAPTGDFADPERVLRVIEQALRILRRAVDGLIGSGERLPVQAFRLVEIAALIGDAGH